MERFVTRQKQPYGCGLYSVASAITRRDFITDERIEASKKGNNMYQLSKWLEQDGISCFIDWLYYDGYNENKGLPEDFALWPTEEKHILPLLLNVQLVPEGLHHLIAVHVDYERRLYQMDSLKGQIRVESEWKDILLQYHRVFGVAGFISIETGNWITLYE